MISALRKALTSCHISPAATAARGMSARCISSSVPSKQVAGKVMREPPPDSLVSFSTQFYRHPSAPVVVGWIDLEPPILDTTNNNSSNAPLQAMNRNARVPKRANHGKRAVSRQARRAKKRAIGNHKR